jgi:hypothetical protein
MLLNKKTESMGFSRPGLECRLLISSPPTPPNGLWAEKAEPLNCPYHSNYIKKI